MTSSHSTSAATVSFARSIVLLPAERSTIRRQRRSQCQMGTSTLTGAWMMPHGTRSRSMRYPVHLHAPTLQFSEFLAWSDVSCLFAPYYETAKFPRDGPARSTNWPHSIRPGSSRRRMAPLHAAGASLFRAVFRRRGLMPRGLAAIWSSRFGDCKDAPSSMSPGHAAWNWRPVRRSPRRRTTSRCRISRRRRTCSTIASCGCA